MTPLELVQYYANLLILQYNGLRRAAGTVGAFASGVLAPQTTVQSVVFSATPTAGAFSFEWTIYSTASIAYNASAGTIQTRLRAIPGLGSVVVTGSIAAGLTVVFTGVVPPADSLAIAANTLTASAVPVTGTVTETDVTLPFAIQDAFNLTGANLAVGVQLDTLGKYAGVSRTGQGFTTEITLSDADFYKLIQLATVKNSAGSSLADIQNLLYRFFPGEVLVFDYANMHMSYLISTAVGSQDLVQLFVTEGLLPRPMGVQLAGVIYAPIINKFFGFGTYFQAAFNSEPFNRYNSYHTDWLFLSYAQSAGF